MCQCTQCETTDSYAQKGFAAWPKGETATPGEAKRLYAAHAAYNWKDARKSASIGASGAGFYGIPKGLTRNDVENILRQSFAPSQTVEA